MKPENIKDHSQWPIALALLGLGVAAPAAGGGQYDALLIGLGIGLIGIGEMRNRQVQQSIHFDSFGRVRFKVSRFPFSPTLMGVALDAAGILLAGLGLLRLA